MKVNNSYEPHRTKTLRFSCQATDVFTRLIRLCNGNMPQVAIFCFRKKKVIFEMCGV